MNIATAKFLISPAGLELLNEASTSDKNAFNLAAYLRTKTTSEFAAAISTMIDLRKKGLKKFCKAEEMLFTRSGLEQASAEEISNYRSKRFTAAGISKIADLCCGIGGDSISFAQHLEVTGIDLDPGRLLLAEHNTGVYSVKNSFDTINNDITQLQLEKMNIEAFFVDPARRTANGKRIFQPENWSPRLSEIKYILENKLASAGIKCAPGMDYSDIPNNADIEFISFNGELRECVLWFGALKNGVKRQATLLPSGDTLYGKNPVIKTGKIKDYIYEPDSAVMRAGLVELLGSRIGAEKISETICFLSSDKIVTTPFAKCYRVESIFDYKEKELKTRLKEADCKTVNIIKRGVGVDIPTLMKRLKLKGSRHLTLILTRNFEKKVGIIVSPI